jgi:ABC-type lipoprotein export system ATPase subunit
MADNATGSLSDFAKVIEEKNDNVATTFGLDNIDVIFQNCQLLPVDQLFQNLYYAYALQWYLGGYHLCRLYP